MSLIQTGATSNACAVWAAAPASVPTRDVFDLSVIHVAQQSLARAKLSSTSLCCVVMLVCCSLPPLVLNVVFGDLAQVLEMLQP
jgi:hypothetical protein